LKSDIAISQNAQLEPIREVAARYGIDEAFLLLHGPYKAKVTLDFLQNTAEDQSQGKYIDVTCITPTPFGEGKTVTSVGLCQGLGFLGKKAAVCIRQPSLGPTFGIKGGAAGGGYSQIVPMEDFNLHLTGDMHAVGIAHNLIAAALDARLFHENKLSDTRLAKKGFERLDIDPYQIMWRRVMDINDRALREINIGLGGSQQGVPRESGFDITPASELMAILALAENFADLRQRVGRVVVAFNKKGKPVTAEDLGVAGAATVLLKDALLPNMMQTLEGQLAFVHTGPFANIAHGNSSIIADRIALKAADYVVTESGFGADIGMEKFFDIKCRNSGLQPDAVVLVCTIRGLKLHGGGPKVTPGRKLDPVYQQENLDMVRKGAENLKAHLQVVAKFGVPAVVCINSFPSDTPAEHALVQDIANEAGAAAAVIGNYHQQGGEGAAQLAEAVIQASERKPAIQYAYSETQSINEKIETLCREIYGADGVTFSAEAQKQMRKFEKAGYGDLPICMAKTQYSISHDPNLKGWPTGFTVPVRELRLSAGAGFIYVLAGDIQTMPGLPLESAFQNVDLDPETGVIQGLF
jgi:methylenetetrahydrofolate dehydrogenase (NADP+)/methenyltetrahydrofolate cyclohydrolase/formyltetrahydrofolate synthetase/formate--tetrahydrofolate ligase